MKGVILVGGEGTRLRPLTSRLPKPMVPIANRPFLVWMIGWIKSYGIDDIVLALCYLPDRIREILGDGRELGVRLSYVVEDSPLGTAGAVKNAAGHIDDTCFVFNGDILTDLDLGAMLAAHRAAGATLSISLTPVEDPSAYGVVESEPDGRILRFTEKPKREEARSNLINAGTYILEPEVLDTIPENTFWMFERKVFPDLLATGARLQAFPSDAYWIDIGTPAKYHDVQRDLLSSRIQLGGGQLAGGDDVALDATATVEDSIVGGGTVVGAGARIFGRSVVGPGCIIGANAVIEDSIVWAGVTIGEDVTLRGAIVADGASIGAGSKLGECVIGSDVRIGSGNRLDRGVRIMPDGVIGPETITFG